MTGSRQGSANPLHPLVEIQVVGDCAVNDHVEELDRVPGTGFNSQVPVPGFCGKMLIPRRISIFLSTFAREIKKKFNKEVKNKEMSYLTTEKKAKIFADFGGRAANTGSIEGQIAMLTERINHISNHLKTNKKDFSSQRGLMQMVGQRKRLLTYLSKHNLTGYRALIEKLGLRK